MATSSVKSQSPTVKLAAFQALVQSNINKLNLTKLEEEKDHAVELKRFLEEAVKTQEIIVARIEMAIFDKRERRYADIAIAAEKAFNDGGQDDPDLKGFMKVFNVFAQKFVYGDVSEKRRGRPAKSKLPPPVGVSGAAAKSKKGP